MGTLVMIHGMWGGPWYWNNYIDYFSARRYSCLAPTLRYHDMDPGSQPDPRLGTTSLLDYARDLEDEIADLSEKPVLIGHSMGGLLAQMLAARGLASAAVLLTPASPAGIMALKPSVLRTFWSVMKTWGFWKKPMRIPLEAAAYSILNALPREEQQEKHDRFVYESGRAAFEIGFWVLDRNRASRVDENNLNCPVLVIAGGKDRITPLPVVKKVAEKYKNRSTFMGFAEHGHWIVEEKGWETAAAAILGWMEQKALQDE